MAEPAGGQRLQKLLSQLGLASRRQAEAWIRAGRLSVNGRPALLGMRVSEQDQLRLDGRLVRQGAALAARAAPVLLCHRSPGEPLSQLTERLPRRTGRRFVSVSPMPTPDGGLELLTADGALATRLQRAVRTLEVEFHLRVRGELSAAQQSAILAGRLDSGAPLRVLALEPSGGEGSNRWYRLCVLGASGAEVRRLIERQAVTLVRALRTRLGALLLPPTLARGRWRALSAAELSGLLGSPVTDP
ncbi:MAG TPA: S4 domain-containing protein [Steroidobacteraceae bacterium]|nr:S4 domain-containing protein [Steroidobacteraceae bacterium]